MLIISLFVVDQECNGGLISVVFPCVQRRDQFFVSLSNEENCDSKVVLFTCSVFLAGVSTLATIKFTFRNHLFLVS